jgi:crossover junction endodeoxyribonuclease RuvC
MRDVCDLAQKQKRSLVGAIEYCHAMPKQGVTSMFKFGTNYGIWHGILAALQIPFYIARPAQWQKGVIKKAQDKKPAVAAAARIFPGAELHGPRGGAKDGRADALLIAYWCRRQ